MKRILSFFAVVCLLALGACHPEPFLSVSPDSLSFTESGGSQTVQISANYAWTASVSGSGFKVSPSSGEGDATVTVTADATSSPDEVSGTLNVMSEGLSASVSLKQSAKPTLVLGDSAKVPASGGMVEIPIQYNTDYTVEVEPSAQSWIKFVKTKSLSSGRLEFEISANDGDERSGKVTLKDKSGKVAPVTITIVQEAEPKVLVVGDAATVPAEGATVEVDVQYNVDYSVEIDKSAQSWIHYVETRTVQNGKLVFKVDANDGEERSGKVTLKDKSGKVAPVTITFVQEMKIVINVVGEVPRIPTSGGHFYIPVEYNVPFNAIVDEDSKSWSSSGVNDDMGVIVLSVSENYGDERSGKIRICDYDGKIEPFELTFTQDASVYPETRRILMEFYDAMDGPNWTRKNYWGSDESLSLWDGVMFDNRTGRLELYFNSVGLKGKIPDCIGELTNLTSFRLQYEDGLKGTLPASFANLVNLESFELTNTSISSLPDVFYGMKNLNWVMISRNEDMTGPLPESLGLNDEYEALNVSNNSFTGAPPSSWARHYKVITLWGNHLSGKIPEAYLTGDEVGLKLAAILNQAEGYGFDISDIDVPGCLPYGPVIDLDGKMFDFADIVKKNKYTVFLSWAPWCPFSKGLMPNLLDYYKKYRNDGLEIIATVMWDDDSNLWTDIDGQRREVKEKGYDLWYNYYFQDYMAGMGGYPASTPQAEVYDNEGNILFSGFSKYPGPDTRHRFGHPASTDLIPFLETLLGPAVPDDPYTSTDYSKDGEVMTLQKATVGNGIDVVFMGDGYTDREMGEGGLYDTLMKQAMEEFFALEPYKTFRNRFNVYAVKVVSPNWRVSDGHVTALGTFFGNGTETDGDTEKCYEYALKVPGISDRKNLLVNVLVNTSRHAGTAVMSWGLQSSVAFTSSMNNDPEYFGPVLRHEAGGHGFAFLADEYFTYQTTPPESHVAEYNSVYEKYGWFANVDFTNDPQKIRWSAFLSDSRYKDEVGIFQGGALYAFGAYRPSKNSMMNENYEYYNAPSRRAIYQQIMKRSGEEYSFEKFLEYDAVNRGAAAAAARPPLKAAAATGRRFEHTAPPKIVP